MTVVAIPAFRSQFPAQIAEADSHTPVPAGDRQTVPVITDRQAAVPVKPLVSVDVSPLHLPRAEVSYQVALHFREGGTEIARATAFDPGGGKQLFDPERVQGRGH